MPRLDILCTAHTSLLCLISDASSIPKAQENKYVIQGIKNMCRKK
jgi:hypothetical protein